MAVKLHSSQMHSAVTSVDQKAPTVPQSGLGLFQWLQYHAYTVLLFTARDFATIMFPVSLFASVAAPAPSLCRWLLGVWWLFINLFHINVSNQYKSGDEDIINRGHYCLASVPFGWDVTLVNLGLLITILSYDNMLGSHNWLLKSSLNVLGYGLLEYATSRVMAGEALDRTAIISILCSVAVIFTTIQAADFADVIGDKAVGRLTMPIHLPELSRILTFLGLFAWSSFLANVWRLGLLSATILVAFGTWIGFRFYRHRTQKADTFSYVLYNFWILTIHLLPAQSRWQILSL